MAADAHEIHKTSQNTRDQNKTLSSAHKNPDKLKNFGWETQDWDFKDVLFP